MISNYKELANAQLEDLLLAGVRGLRARTPALCAESLPRYAAVPSHRSASVTNLLQCACELLRRQELLALQRGPALTSPTDVKDYLHMHFAGYEHEAFVVVFLDAQHQVLTIEEMFRGTLNQASVYPREIVKRALQLAAGAVVLAHNHPSGLAEPSRADEYLTLTLKSALQLIDVRVLDHLVVGQSSVVSFSERGLL